MAIQAQNVKIWPCGSFLGLASHQRPSRAIFIKGWQNGNFIKAGQPQWPFYQSRLQFYAYGRFINNGRFIKIEDHANGRNGRFINQKRANGMLGCGWPISYCPAQAVYQRPGRAFLERAGKASGRQPLINCSYGATQKWQSKLKM